MTQTDLNKSPDSFKSPGEVKAEYNVAALMQAGETYSRLGLDCPWVGEDAYVGLEGQMIRSDERPCGDIDDGAVTWDEVYCPPAVADAVVAFAGRLADAINDGSVEFDRVYSASIHYHSDEFRYSWSVSGWPHKCDSCGRRDSPVERGDEDSRIEAAVALILAVHKAVEGE